MNNLNTNSAFDTSSHKLIVCEKPSVACSIASALGIRERKKGYLEGKDWLVSWCVGHLAELADAQVYDEKYAKWRQRDLPIIPRDWQYVVPPDKQEQFQILRTLMNSDRVSGVVAATDAGREGESIFRTVYNLVGCNKPVERLWISSMEDDAIREGFANLKPGSEYDGLYNAAVCRAKADWLVGINATRFFSLLYNRTLRIGRVVSPTLALIVQRENAIAGFTPTPFYTVELDCGGMTLAGERISAREDAEALANACKNGTVIIQTADRREKSEKAPALYDLTTLQREANRTLGFTAQQTLDYLQALYEKKLCTYPRTDSRYLTGDMETAVPVLVDVAAALCDVSAPLSVLASQVCNSAKVSDHHAVVPTRSAAKTDPASLPVGEREILWLVSSQLLRAVSPPFRYAETVVTAECAGHTFTAKGKVILDQGWKIYGEPSKETSLPEGLAEGKALPVRDAQVKEGKTSPPKHHTEDSVLQSMETAGIEDMPTEVERKGIGTPATRAGILEKLVSSGLVERKKAKKVTNLVPTQAGNSLIAVLPEALQSPLLTAEWEQRLCEVERGTLTPDAFLDGIASLVTDLVQTYQPVPGSEKLFPSGKEVIGPCPRCGGDVTEGKKGFFCENPACKFVLWKENRFFAAKKKTLTKAVAASLLNKGKVPLKDCYSERTGKTYDAIVTLEDDGEKTDYKLTFENGGKKKK